MIRVVLFLATTLAILAILSLAMYVFLPMLGIRVCPASYSGLLVMALIFGFGGSFLSLAMSKWMAKTTTRMQLVNEPRSEGERWLVETVRRQAEQAGIKMPEVGIYEAPEINAFATGPSRNNALVAVSTGLLRAMDRDEAEAVLGHEISHVANGDMVTMTLLQGVLNTFVIFLSRVIGRIIDGAIGGGRDGPGLGYYAIVLVLDLVFGLFASMIAMWFSRQREFRADAGGASLAGRGKMIAALQRLSQTYGENTLPKQVAAFGISGAVAHGLQGLFRSHPPLEERIARLQQQA
jgi:heat shock protein HtpX